MLHYPCALSQGGEVWLCLKVKPIQMSPEALRPAGSASASDWSSPVLCEWAGTLLMEHWVTRGVGGGVSAAPGQVVAGLQQSGEVQRVTVVRAL